MEEFKNKYVVRLNEKGRIIKTFSDVFDEILDTDTIIGEGISRHFVVDKEVLSEGLQVYANIENGLPLINEFGIYQLKYENGIISKISEEELQEEFESLPKAQPTEIEVLKEENLVLMGALTDLYEENLVLKNENLQTMLAVTELYEMIL